MSKLVKGEFLSAREARRLLMEAESVGVSESKLAQARAHVARLELEEGTREQFERVEEIAPQGWFKDYLRYARASEAPYLFHLLNSLALASHHIGRRRYFFLTGQSIYAPISVFLSSPAGLAQRGQSIAQLGRVAKYAGSSVLLDKATPESLVRYLSEHPHTLFMSEEASMLLNPKDYMSDMVQTLCRLLDGDDNFGIGGMTKTEQVAARNVTLNMVLSSSPGMIVSMPKSAISGGLLSRIILVWAFRTERVIPFPDAIISEEELTKMAKALARELKAATKTLKPHGIRYEGSVRRYYELWYQDNSKLKSKSSSKMSHWYGRRAAHLHRINATFQTMKDGSWVIDQDTLDRGIALIELVEAEMEHVYRSASLSPSEKRMQAIIDALARKGGVSTPSKVYASIYGSFDGREQFEKVVDELVELKFVARERVRRKQRGRPMTVLKLLRRG
ncbi:MAG: DUF3987 domain-containing protein [Deltaproteobacteria bacterium]|nr:MAG: DUF3987 domain-containing protein [Deltaproteobacteria bacterium]